MDRTTWDPRLGNIYGQNVAQGPVADAGAYGALLQKIREDELKKQALARGAAAVQAVRAGQAPVVVPQAPAPTPVTTTAMPGGTTGPLPQSAIEARQIISGKPKMNQPRQNVMASEMPEVQTEPTVMQERAGAQEESPKVPTPEESVKLATDIIQKSDAPEDVKKDQIEQVMSNPDLPQKLAMIAMAVAPTLVGYAAFGKKGAYLGAAATGKGLEAGTKQYIEDEQFKQKMDLEREKKEKAGVGTYDKEVTDKYGQIYVRGKDNVARPLLDQNGQPMFEANVPVAKWNEQLGRMETTMKYESRPTEAFGEMTAPAVKLQSIKRGVESVRKKPGMKDFDIYIPDNDKAFIDKMQSLGHSIDNPRPPMVNGRPLYDQKTYDQYVASAKNSQALAEEKLRAATSGIGKTGRPPAVKEDPVDVAARNTYDIGVRKWNEIRYWQDWKSKQSKAEILLKSANKLQGTGDGGMADPDLWFNYMKEVQGDNSVIREGDISTALRFMELKTRIGGYLEMLQGGSAMSPTMRKEMTDYLSQVRAIKEKNMMRDINTKIAQGMAFRRPFVGSNVIVDKVARDEAIRWAAPRISRAVPVLGIQPNTPMWNQALQREWKAGKIKNGGFVRDLDGDHYLIEAQQNSDGSVSVFPYLWVVKP